jgi:predicted dehydrogenase
MRVGLIGCCDIAQYHCRALEAAGAEVVGAVTSRAVPEPLVRYESVGALLANVDAATIAVPNYRHAHLCAEALALDEPVLVEKPLCVAEEYGGLMRTFVEAVEAGLVDRAGIEEMLALHATLVELAEG